MGLRAYQGVPGVPGVGAVPLHSGFLYGSPAEQIVDNPATQNMLSAVPVVVPNACVANSLGVMVGTPAAANVFRLGIYADNVGVPGALILDAGTVSAATSGFKQLAIAQALAPGVYWLAGVLQGGTGASALVILKSALNLPSPNPPIATSSNIVGFDDTVARAAALPATFGPGLTLDTLPLSVIMGIQ